MDKNLPFFDRVIVEFHRVQKVRSPEDPLFPIELKELVESGLSGALEYPEKGAYKLERETDIPSRTRNLEFRFKVLFNNLAEYFRRMGYQNHRQVAYDYFSGYFYHDTRIPKNRVKATLYFTIKEIQEREGLERSIFMNNLFG